MTHQSKRDVIAAGSVALMFAGAFILPSSWLGLVPIALGVMSMLLVILVAVRES